MALSCYYPQSVQKQLRALPNVIHTRVVVRLMDLSDNPCPSGVKKLYAMPLLIYDLPPSALA